MRTQTNLHSGAGVNIDTQQLANILAANGVQVSRQQLQQLEALAGQIDMNQLMLLLSMYGVNTEQASQLLGGIPNTF